jgi:monoamine oxidase
VKTCSEISYSSKAVVVTCPLNVLKNIEFYPPLKKNLLKASQTVNGSRCYKVLVHADGLSNNYDHCMNWPGIVESYVVKYDDGASIGDDTTRDSLKSGYVVIFALEEHVFPDGSRDSIEETREHLRRHLSEHHPNIIIKEWTMYDFVKDPLFEGTWMAFRPGTAPLMSTVIDDVNNPLEDDDDGEDTSCVVIAGGDVTRGWGGWVDGAITSAEEAVRTVTTKFNNQ